MVLGRQELRSASRLSPLSRRREEGGLGMYSPSGATEQQTLVGLEI